MKIRVKPTAGKEFPIEHGRTMPADGDTVELTPFIQFLINCGDLVEVTSETATPPATEAHEGKED